MTYACGNTPLGDKVVRVVNVGRTLCEGVEYVVLNVSEDKKVVGIFNKDLNYCANYFTLVHRRM